MDNTGIQFNLWLDSHDESAFRTLYESLYRMLLDLAVRYVPLETAKDVVQDTFLKVWNSPEKYAAAKDLRFYLLRSVQNSCLNHIRNRKVEERFRDSVPMVEENVIYQVMLEEDIFTMMRKAINDLPEIYRDVLSCSLEGMSDREVSEKLNISVDNVKTRKKRAKTLLRDILRHPLAILLLNLI